MKRFFLIDTISGRLPGEKGKNVVFDDRAELHEQFSQISYVKTMELRIYMNEDDEGLNGVNKIKLPILILEYSTLNFTNSKNHMHKSQDQIDFSFKIRFIKRPNLNFFFQIILPILLTISFFYALLQSFFYKVRQQKTEYDFAILLKFIVNLASNISAAVFAFILIYVCFVFIVYKTQSKVIKILLPLNTDAEKIGILLAIAVIFKVNIKYLKKCFR